MSNSTTNFNNFDASAFKQKDQTSGMTRLLYDPCEQQAQDVDNGKKLKFMTTNHIDLLNGATDYNFFSIGLKDQLFVPGEKVDTWSNLLNGSIMTNCKVKNEYGQLPIQIGYHGQGYHGDVTTEDSIRNNGQVKKKSCLPVEDKFYNRSFTLFKEAGIEVPKAIRSVETPEDGFNLGRNGISTRFTDRFQKK
jgi:hypothetical protein